MKIQTLHIDLLKITFLNLFDEARIYNQIYNLYNVNSFDPIENFETNHDTSICR